MTTSTSIGTTPTPLDGSSRDSSIKGNSNPVCAAVAGRS